MRSTAPCVSILLPTSWLYPLSSFLIWALFISFLLISSAICFNATFRAALRADFLAIFNAPLTAIFIALTVPPVEKNAATSTILITWLKYLLTHCSSFLTHVLSSGINPQPVWSSIVSLQGLKQYSPSLWEISPQHGSQHDTTTWSHPRQLQLHGIKPQQRLHSIPLTFLPLHFGVHFVISWANANLVMQLAAHTYWFPCFEVDFFFVVLLDTRSRSLDTTFSRLVWLNPSMSATILRCPSFSSYSLLWSIKWNVHFIGNWSGGSQTAFSSSLTIWCGHSVGMWKWVSFSVLKVQVKDEQSLCTLYSSSLADIPPNGESKRKKAILSEKERRMMCD